MYEPVPVTFTPVAGDQGMKLTLDMEKEGVRNKGWHIYPCAWPAEVLLHFYEEYFGRMLLVVAYLCPY